MVLVAAESAMRRAEQGEGMSEREKAEAKAILKQMRLDAERLLEGPHSRKNRVSGIGIAARFAFDVLRGMAAPEALPISTERSNVRLSGIVDDGTKKLPTVTLEANGLKPSEATIIRLKIEGFPHHLILGIERQFIETNAERQSAWEGFEHTTQDASLPQVQFYRRLLDAIQKPPTIVCSPFF